ncbi:DUF4123 domain-containing protein [Paracoccus siganidrum]|uniref:DUF4123 domain-containing protein n=1 Tax=Paracoccus siganidrum TaxID=1276757 RepID=A0A419AC29_9RHOB|nr:DUF4123 domain-containing protein [Paracoccus siganidrum]RJL21518.1 DUF4123 domain-containing protein [Paracoccus siganidrum]RMC30946.1 hypothetical protein C9E82_16995 [Paracoccus siganidrum]
MPIDDPWSIPSPDRPEDQVAIGQGALVISELSPPTPLDLQIGWFPKSNVPAFLRDALFAETDSQTFAILDAAKVTGLSEMLEHSGLEHRCLFKGKAYDDLGDVAPWLVRLEENNGFTRNLFTRGDASWHLWQSDPGIYLRSTASLEELWQHFRKFIRMRDSQENWLLFRFWETGYLYSYLRHFATNRPDLIRRLCLTRDGMPITFINCSFGKEVFQQASPRVDLLEHVDAAPPILDEQERAALKALRRQQNTYEMARDLKGTYPQLAAVALREVYRRVDLAQSFMRSIGVSDGLLIGRYILLSTVYLPKLQESPAFRAAVTRPGATAEENLRDSLDVLKLQLSRMDGGFRAWW